MTRPLDEWTKWTSNVNSIIAYPKEFFKNMPTKGGYKEPLIFSIINTLLGSVLSFFSILAMSGSAKTIDEILQILGLDISGLLLIWIALSLIVGTIGLFLSSAIYHMILKLTGAKKNYEATFRIMAYLSAFYLISWIPIINIFIAFYLIYVLIIASKQVHKMNIGQSLVAVLLILGATYVISSIETTTLANISTLWFENTCEDEPGCPSKLLIQLKDPTNDNIMQTMTVLEKRINAHGLEKTQIHLVKIKGNSYIEIKTKSATEEEVRDIIKRPGKFEATIDRNINLQNNTATFNFNKNPYDTRYLPDRNAIEIGDDVLEVDDTIEVEGIIVKYVNKTSDDVVTLKVYVITSEDITQVFNDAQDRSISGVGSSWHFEFTIKISQEAAERFATVTEDLTKVYKNNRNYLSSNIDLYIDDELIDSLKISSEIQGKAQTDIQIRGPGNSKEDAIKNMNQLKSILESGPLPTEIEIIQ